MDFARKRKRGMDSQVEKYWFSECGQYRINWRSEVFGVKVTPRHHACVRVVERDGYEWWNFCGRRSPYKKFSTALEAAEKHRRVWEYALKLAAGDRKGRADRLRALEIKSRVGTGNSSNSPLSTLPCWVSKSGDPALRNLTTVLFPVGRRKDDECEDHSDPTNPSETCESVCFSVPIVSSTSTTTSGPASHAGVTAASMTPPIHHAQSKGIRCEMLSCAPTAEAPDASPSKSSKPRTRKPSTSTRKKKRATKGSSKPVGSRSRNSRVKNVKH